MSTLTPAGEYAVGLMTIRGAFKVGAAGAVGAIADANTNSIASVTLVSEGVYEVTLASAKNGVPNVPTQILTPLCGVCIEDITPAAAEHVDVKYVVGSWSPTTRKFRLVTIGVDDMLVEDPDDGASVWFCLTGPIGPTGIDVGFTL